MLYPVKGYICPISGNRTYNAATSGKCFKQMRVWNSHSLGQQNWKGGRGWSTVQFAATCCMHNPSTKTDGGGWEFGPYFLSTAGQGRIYKGEVLQLLPPAHLCRTTAHTSCGFPLKKLLIWNPVLIIVLVMQQPETRDCNHKHAFFFNVHRWRPWWNSSLIIVLIYLGKKYLHSSVFLWMTTSQVPDQPRVTSGTFNSVFILVFK